MFKHARTPIGFIDPVMITVIVLGAVWLSTPSVLFVNPVATTFDLETNRVTVVRKTPFGTVEGRWHTEIQALTTGEECSSGPGWTASTYQVVEGDDGPPDTVSYPIGEWAADCVEVPFIIQDTRQVLLWGLIPLRPVRTNTLVKPI